MSADIIDIPRGRIPAGPREPPYDGEMEARIARIEARVDSVEQALGRVEVKLQHVDLEVSQTKWYVLGSTLTILLAMVATVLGTGVAIQQMTVSTFQAASAQQVNAAAAAPTVIVVPATAAAPSASSSGR